MNIGNSTLAGLRGRLFLLAGLAVLPGIALEIAERGSLWTPRVGLLLAVMVLVMLMARAYCHRMVLGPVDRLRQAARSIGKGEFHHGLDLQGQAAEFTELGRALEVMAERLAMREEAILFREHLLSTLLNAASDSILLLSPQGQVLAANQQAARLRGASTDDLAGRSIFDFMAPDLADTRRRMLRKAAATGAPLEFEEERGSRTFSLRLYPVADKSGRVVQVASFSQDVTKLRRHEKTLLAAKRAAEEANNAKTQLLSNISHELRTPLNGILGAAQIMLSDASGRENSREWLEMINDSARNLLAGINNLLELAALESGKVRFSTTLFGLRHCLEELLESYRLQAERKGLDLSLKIDPELPAEVNGDEFRLRQILGNLLSNALRFTEQGSVTLEASLKKQEGATAQARFCVRDTGVGVPAELRESIFESFTLGEHFLTKQRSGAGLGLTIARGLVELMGGKMWCESRVGAGSSFWFRLDLGVPAREPAVVVPAPAPEAPEPGLRILVAEDESVNAHYVCHLLRRKGHETVTVPNGAAAIEALRNETFDMVLMDIQMPGMDGIEATRLIRRGDDESINRHLPIVALTAFATGQETADYLSLGMDDLLPKPFTPPDLFATMDKVLRKGQRARA